MINMIEKKINKEWVRFNGLEYVKKDDYSVCNGGDDK